MARASNNGWEDSSGSIISCETGLAHTGSVVNNKSSNVLVTHVRADVSAANRSKIKTDNLDYIFPNFYSLYTLILVQEPRKL